MTAKESMLEALSKMTVVGYNDVTENSGSSYVYLDTMNFAKEFINNIPLSAPIPECGRSTDGGIEVWWNPQKENDYFEAVRVFILKDGTFQYDSWFSGEFIIDSYKIPNRFMKLVNLLK